jgi:GntR family transcriptional regulator
MIIPRRFFWSNVTVLLDIYTGVVARWACITTLMHPEPPIRIHVDPNSGVPAFRQVVEQIRFHIAGGLLSAGAELPSTRVLSQELGLNPMTISKAFGVLEQEGLIERRPGLPLVVRPLARSARAREGEALLRAALRPALRAAQQLDIAPEKSAEIFRQLLMDATNTEREVE